MQLTWQVYCAYAAWAIQMKFNIGKNGSKYPKQLPCAQHQIYPTLVSPSHLSANMTAWDLRRHDRSSSSPKEPEGAVVFVLWKPITNNQVVYSVSVCGCVCGCVCDRYFMGLPCARLLLLGHVDHVTTGQQHLFNKLLHLITKSDKENAKGKKNKGNKQSEIAGTFHTLYARANR